MRFMMHLHGFTLDKDENDQPVLTDKPEKKKTMSGFIFQDPSMYEDMTPEERKAETKRMMGLTKQAMQGTKMKEFGVDHG